VHNTLNIIIADDYSLRSLKTSVYSNLNSRAGEGVGILGDKTYPGEWIENSFSHMVPTVVSDIY
jgi:hypothetical protein